MSKFDIQTLSVYRYLEPISNDMVKRTSDLALALAKIMNKLRTKEYTYEETELVLKSVTYYKNSIIPLYKRPIDRERKESKIIHLLDSSEEIIKPMNIVDKDIEKGNIKSSPLTAALKSLGGGILKSNMLEITRTLAEEFMLISLAGCLQGQYVPEIMSPAKLVIISDKVFQKNYEMVKNEYDSKYNIMKIFGLFPDNLMINAFVETDGLAGRYGFCMRKQDGRLEIVVFDHLSGNHVFFTDERKEGVLTSGKVCFRRDGKRCPYASAKDSEDRCQCVTPWKDCPTHKYQIVSAVLVSLQELFIAKQHRLTQIHAENANEKSDELDEILKDESLINIYDYHFDETSKTITAKKDISHSSGYEMQPHFRNGTMRYNKKTGKRDIPVKASFIHKEKYKGYASADRIK